MNQVDFCVMVSTGSIFLGKLFGWPDPAVELLLFVMICDLLTGVLDGIAGGSSKTEKGYLSSKAFLRGVCKKVGMMLLVAISNMAGNYLDTTFMKAVTVNALIASELISIIENLGLLGVPVPAVITDAIELLKGGKGSGDSTEVHNK